MNNFTTVTIISWETRNWRHRQKAVAWCKDYGLEPVLRTLYMGKLYPKERVALLVKFTETFQKKTEKFFITSVCKSCFETVAFDDTLKHMKEKVGNIVNFELIQIAEPVALNHKKTK